MNELKVRNLNEVVEDYKKELKEKLENPVWGKWTYDYSTKHLCYNIRGEDDDYHVCLHNINQSSQILDWIFQLNGKPWMDAKDIKDFLDAVDFLLGPQANYCSCGRNKICDANTLLPEKP